MKIKGWEKISGFTYKGYCIVNPIHDANEEGYFATVLNLNQVYRPKWDITLSAYAVKGVIKFSILDNESQHLLAKAHLTKVNIETPQKFREQYEMLVDDILEEAQSYTKTGTTGSSQGIINQVQTAGTTVAYSSHSISNGLNNLSVMQQALNAMKELEEQLDELKKQYPL
jgi:polyhydroxyalkanoate synthesis regulator phasin